jgi:hypothetical protein
MSELTSAVLVGNMEDHIAAILLAAEKTRGIHSHSESVDTRIPQRHHVGRRWVAPQACH